MLDFFQSAIQAYLENENHVLPSPITYYLSMTSSVALPVSYRRLVGAKAIKLGSRSNILNASRVSISMSGLLLVSCTSMVEHPN